MVIITNHAVERFVKRHAPHLTFRQAREILQTRVSSLGPTKAKTFNGEALWAMTDPPCLLVVKRDSTQKNYVVVTVLPSRPALIPTDLCVEGSCEEEEEEGPDPETAEKLLAYRSTG